jgi:hypothetical protein
MVQAPTPNQVVSDPRLFASTFLRILDKQKKPRRLVWNNPQAHFHSNRTGRDLVLKARQLGISTYVQGEMYRRTVTSTRTTITLAHDDPTTDALRRMADRFWENCQFNGIQPLRKYANAALTTYPEFDSEALISKAGSKNVGRGTTITDFHGSEVAFWPDAEKLVSGAMQAGNPDVILESTPNGAQGYFYERCMEAIHKQGVWKLHFYPWWWDPAYSMPLEDGEVFQLSEEESILVQRLLLDGIVLKPEQIKWRRNKKSELKHLFPQEYPEDPLTCFLTSGNSYFGDISGVFTAPFGATWQEGHKYGAGLDFGQTSDFTCMIVIDRTTHQMVDFLHINKLEWSEMRRQIKQMYNKWHLTSLLAETNSIGSVNIEALQKTIINPDGSKDPGIQVQGFDMTNDSKHDIAADLYESLHTNELKLMDVPVLRHELNTFVSTQLPGGGWRLAAEGTGHDDTVIGLMLANQNVPIQIFV